MHGNTGAAMASMWKKWVRVQAVLSQYAIVTQYNNKSGMSHTDVSVYSLWIFLHLSFAQIVIF